MIGACKVMRCWWDLLKAATFQVAGKQITPASAEEEKLERGDPTPENNGDCRKSPEARRC